MQMSPEVRALSINGATPRLRLLRAYFMARCMEIQRGTFSTPPPQPSPRSLLYITFSVRMCVRPCTSMRVFGCVCAYVCVCLCVLLSMCVCMCTRLCPCVCLCACASVWVYVCTCEGVRARVCVCICVSILSSRRRWCKKG